MGRHEHPSADLRCEAVGCGRRAHAISEIDGRLLCHDCWSFSEGQPVVWGAGFGAWMRRIFRRR